MENIIKIGDIVIDKNRNLGKVLSIFDDIKYDPYTFKKYNSLSAAVHFFDTKATWVTSLSELKISIEPRFLNGDIVTVGSNRMWKILRSQIGGDGKLYYIVESTRTLNDIEIAIQDLLSDSSDIELYKNGKQL